MEPAGEMCRIPHHPARAVDEGELPVSLGTPPALYEIVREYSFLIDSCSVPKRWHFPGSQ